MSDTNATTAIEGSPTVPKQDDTYVREDGKTVRRVRKSSLGSTSEAGSMEGDVYIRADGKKVRRVKRSAKKTVDEITKSNTGAELPPKAPVLLPEPMFPGDPPEELLKGIQVETTPAVTVVDPKTTVPQELESDLSSRVTEAETIKVVDPALIAATLNKIEDLTTQDEGKNPWTSVPSFEESVKSMEHVQKEKAAILINPFEVFQEVQPQVYLVPIEEDSPPPSLPVPDEREVQASPVSSSQASHDALCKITAAVTATQPPPPSSARGSNDAQPQLPSYIAAPVLSNVRDVSSSPAADGHIVDDSITSPLSEASRGFNVDSMPTPSSRDVFGSDSFDDEDPPPRRKFSPPKFRLPESITSKTRSRADVDTFDGAGSIGSYDRLAGGLHQITDADAMVLNATLAHKRVKVVQLLFFGLIGLLAGFLGSFYIQSSCHFINANVVVGANAEVFVLHYGIWKYTPIDSAFQGYTYCTGYDDEYTTDAPLIPRIAGVVSMITGLYALSTLWLYLIFGRASYKFWSWAVGMALLACVCQGLTFLFFVDDVCQRNTCYLGPGGYVGIASTFAWFLVAFEMYYNMPISAMMTHIDPGRNGASVMTNLEPSDFSRGARAYFRRASSGNIEPLPTLNEFQRKKDGTGSVGKGMMELNSVKRSGSYKPPAFD